MTKKELLKALEPLNEYDVVIICDGEGWSNIEEVKQKDSSICITIEHFPIFSDN